MVRGRLHFLALLAVMVIGRSAQAISFSPVAPALCPARTEVNWSYDTTNGQMVPLDDFNCPWCYANRVDSRVQLLANERVTEFWMRFDYFSTENSYDWLYLNSYSPHWPLFGTAEAYTSDVPWVGGQPDWKALKSDVQFPLQNATLRFTTDYSVTSTGIFLGRAAVCSNDPTAALHNYYATGVQARRHSGVLLGTDDIVYVRFPNGSQKSGETCSLAHDTFAVQGDASPGNDFDLYVRCGALPTPSTFDVRDFSSPTQFPPGHTVNTSFIHAPTSCPCGTPWYVAIHSFNGSGWFNLWNHKHYATAHQSTLTVQTNVNATAADITQTWVPQITQGLNHFFGANEGTKYYDTFTFKDNVYPDANITIWDQGNRPHAYCHSDWRCGTLVSCKVYLYTQSTGYGTWEPSTMSHELGHYINCIPDEYSDSAGIYDGHTMMASHWGTQHNYCTCSPQANVCPDGHGDHNHDGSSSSPGPDIYATWDGTNTYAPYTFTETPDNYDFTDFDFHGQYAAAIVTDNP